MGGGGCVSVAWLQPCEIGGAGVALPQVSEEMASAAAVAAKHCYRGEDEAMGGERRARRDTGKDGEKVRFTVRKCRLSFSLFSNMHLFYNRGGGREKKKRGKIKECRGKSEIATAAKTGLVTDDKKMRSSRPVLLCVVFTRGKIG